MELKEFVKKALSDIVSAVDEASSASSREIGITSTSNSRSIEFDVAVTAEDITNGQANGGIKVLSLIGIGAEAKIESEVKNSVVSRISFGVFVRGNTKAEDQKIARELGDHIITTYN